MVIKDLQKKKSAKKKINLVEGSWNMQNISIILDAHSTLSDGEDLFVVWENSQ